MLGLHALASWLVPVSSAPQASRTQLRPADTATPRLPPRDSRSGGKRRSPQPNVKGQGPGNNKGGHTICTGCLIRPMCWGDGHREVPQKRKHQSRDLMLKGGEWKCPGQEPPGIDNSTPLSCSKHRPRPGTREPPALVPSPSAWGLLKEEKKGAVGAQTGEEWAGKASWGMGHVQVSQGQRTEVRKMQPA